MMDARPETGKPRVLYMEDDESLARLVQRRLQRQGFEVDTAPDGRSGLERLRAAAYDVVVLDYRMPNLDGIDVLKELVADAALPPAVMVSGVSSLEVAVEAMRLGAADYVVKETGGNYLHLLPGILERVLDKQRLKREKERAEAALRESELRFRLVSDSASDAIISADARGDVIFWNQGAMRIFGYREEEILGRSLTLLIPERYRELHLKALERVHETGRTQLTGQVVELSGLRRDGTEFPLEISLASWVVGGRRYFSAVIRDVTERKEAEERTRRLLQTQIVINTLLHAATETRDLDRLLDVALDLILTRGWITTLGRGAVFLRDPGKGELVLRAHRDLDPHLLKTCARVAPGHCLCGLVLETGQVIFADAVDDRHSVHGSNMIPHGHYCVPISSDGQLLGVLNIYLPEGHVRSGEEEEFLHAVANTLSGVIERKRLDEELRQAIVLAERANQAKSAFLAAMSHEIRTPMNAILGMGEMLTESHLADEQQHYVRIINSAGEGLLALINDILDLSRIESGQLDLEAIAFDPRELAGGAVDILRGKASAQGLSIELDIDAEVPGQVLGDPQRLRQIVINLLSNAVKFTDGGSVSLAVTPAGAEMLRFAVSDTGIGISEERQQTIFEPFIQAETSTSRRFGGTGLGLSICRQLAERMGGHIRVESRLGEGSTFIVEIPLPRAAPAGAGQPSVGAQTKTMPEAPGGGLSILLADDSEENRMVVKAYLSQSRYRLTIVEDGAQAVARFKEGGVDLVLMDIQMPVMDGYAATREIRAWEQSHDLAPIPVLALTANAMREDVERTREAGCNLHLSKPIRKKRLLETIGLFEAS